VTGEGLQRLPVRGVTLERRGFIRDDRGSLSARQVGAGLPFRPLRYFLVQDVPSGTVRGEHAHRAGEQLLVCTRGSVACGVDDGVRRQEVVLDSPELALYMPAMTWGKQHMFSSDAVLMVLASDGYDAKDYIRDYDEFLRLARRSATDE
jgi:UDP-2-acetamido-3-amino-2,3-dideoxy-glucuronate N-acetyltransferase